MDSSTQGKCPVCGHENELSWVLCDNCGARLPWAPPEKAKISVNEMTDEQLSLRYAPPPQKREPFFLAQRRARPLLLLAVVLGILIWYVLT